MSKELYDEALADARKIREVAEDNAKRALIEATLPRIRKLVDQALMEDIDLSNDMDMAYDDDYMDDQESTILPTVGDDELAADAISMPDEEGKVTLDLDQLDADENDEYELSLESLEALVPLTQTKKVTTAPEFRKQIKSLSESLQGYTSVSKIIKETNQYKSQISKMISQVENMYEYVQESINDPNSKKLYERKLESFFKQLTKLQEQVMPKTRKNRLYEADDMDLDLDDSGESEDMDMDDVETDDGGGEITLKLTGLPDDVELDDLGVDLISGADDDSGDEDMDLDFDDSDSSDDEDDMDLDLDDSGDEDEETNEMMDLSDDTVVEIDENVLRRELARARRIREASETAIDANGHGVGSPEFDDFGGGSDDGEPFLDGEVTVESDDMDDEDVEDVSESRLARRLKIERRIQERAQHRIAALKREGRQARPAKKAVIIRQIRALNVRVNESISRSKKVRAALTESRRSVGLNNRRSQRMESSSNRRAVNNLRAKLSEKNLDNMKLKYTNKLLQNESLSKKQKAVVIERLDEARTPRELKLVYESVSKTLGKRSLNESGTRGSSSRVTRPASTQNLLNEGFETERWAKLAGIK